MLLQHGVLHGSVWFTTGVMGGLYAYYLLNDAIHAVALTQLGSLLTIHVDAAT